MVTRIASSKPQSRRLPLDSLAYALLGAARVCAGVREGRTLRDGLADERRLLGEDGARGGLRSDPIGAIHDLSSRALRRRGRADALLALLAGRVPDPPLLRELLVVAISLLVDLIDPSPADARPTPERAAELPYPPFTLVDQAVHAVVSDAGMARAKGFVNAVLRTLLRRIDEEPEVLREALYGPRAPSEARYELPSWWVARLKTACPDDWEQAARASLALPPLTVRVNVRRTTVPAYLARLDVLGIAVRQVGPVAIRFATPVPVDRIPGFAEGLVSVQDAAAQLAAPLLDLSDGLRVLDACAAPGGKTGHLLEIADVDLTALDSDAGRLARIRENLQRLRLDATLVTGDASRPASWWDGRPFDRILADVPCTASGILRRHPDIRWLRRESDVRRLSLQAQHITDALWSLLYPGGRLLLVTCSVFPEESACHADAFAARHPDAIVRPAPGQLHTHRAHPTLETTDHDGLFFALFEKMR